MAPVVGSWVLRSLSALGRRTWSGCSCPGFSVHLWAFKGPDEWRSLPGRGCGRSRGERGGRLEGFLAGEDVPGGDEDVAGDGGLGGVGLAVALLDGGVEL